MRNFAHFLLLILIYGSMSTVLVPFINAQVSTDTTASGYLFRPMLQVQSSRIRNGRSNIEFSENSYRFREFSLSGYTPIFEKGTKSISNDGKIATVLLTSAFTRTRVEFDEESFASVSRISTGFRLLYSTSPRNIWLLGASPFFAEDRNTARRARPRIYGQLIYSHVVNSKFSYRLGLMYTYMFNGGSFVPVVGFKLGDYQKVFFSLQIPRDVSINWTVNNKLQFSLFSKIAGGIYRFQNTDSLGIRFRTNTLLFTRTDVLTGMAINFTPDHTWYFSLNMGIAHNRNFTLTDHSLSQRNEIRNTYLPMQASPGIFVQISASVYLGKRTYQSGYNVIIEQKALNNLYDYGNSQINRDMNQVNIKDIDKKDLKKVNDKYLDIQDFLFEE